MKILQNHTVLTSRRRTSSFGSLSSYVWRRDFPIQYQDRKSGTQTILKLEFRLTEDERREFKEEIGSNLNGILPLEIKIGKDEEPSIRLVKSGKNTTALADKSARIAQFVAKRIHFNYIPAVRTDDTTIELIANLLSQELRKLENDHEYQKALTTIANLQQPVLDELATRVHGPLKEFLPSIKSVKLEISESNRRISLRRDVNVLIDDGTPTLLEYKGDGVKSLAALGLLKSERATSGASILAIEEPESHLHPAAIHQVSEIIRSISKLSQVIITTHNPLFVDREIIKANVIVSDGGAASAKTIKSIRDILGVKASDNLTNANYALVVEGAEDVISLKALLPNLSDKIGKALKENILIIDSLGGAGNLSYKLSLLTSSLCAVHTLLDSDSAGKNAFSKAENDSQIGAANCTFVNCNGMQESEFEDCLDVNVYKDSFLKEFGVDLDSRSFKGNGKWSSRIRTTFLDQGKLFNESVLAKAKHCVAIAVSKNPSEALNEHKRNSIDALVTALERMLKI